MNWITWAFSKLPLHGVRERFIQGISDRQHQDGITIYADPRDGAVADVYARIAAVRRLMDRIDPARSRRLPALLPTIVVWEGVPTGFLARNRTCVIDRGLLVRGPDALVASYLVHEAAHARLHRHGIDSTPCSEGRVEAVCIRDQIAFLKRLPRDEFPGADRWIEHYAGLAAAGLAKSR